MKNCAAWENVLSAHWVATALNRESLGCFLVFSLFILILCLSVHEKHKHFRVETPPPQPLLSHFVLVSLCVYYYYYVFLMFQKNLIMKQYRINCMHNTKDNLWVLFGSTLCQPMELLRPKTGNPLEIWFWFLSIFNNLMSSCSRKLQTRSGLESYHHNLFYIKT